MAYRRTVCPDEMFSGERLTKALVGIGMRFAERPLKDVNIEDALLAASIAGMDEDDLRVLSVLTTWMEVHQTWVNVDRLSRALKMIRSVRVRAYWAAVGRWLSKDSRFRKLEKLYSGARVELLRAGSEFLIERHGEDARFAGSVLVVPAKSLRRRVGDVASPEEVARWHRTYRQRVIQGPSYRADMWAAVEADPSLRASEIARLTYGSFATAWRVKKDWEILEQAA